MMLLFSKTNLLILSLLIAVMAVFVIAAPVEAQLFSECDNAPADSELCNVVNDPSNSGQNLVTGDDSLVTRIINLIVFLSGAIAVLMIVIGGLRYVLSNGDPQATQSAKNTILYAVVGLVIAVAARTIVIFVLDRL